MIEMRLSELARTVGGRLLGEDTLFRGVVIDSRKVRPGVLFAALAGARSDGHQFVAQSLQTGAVAALVAREIQAAGPQVVVDNVIEALGRLAGYWRQKLDPCVIGITGSNGKTTTREMVAAILRQGHKVLSTQGNYNNELGLPLTLFELAPDDEFAVLEMGAGKPGDIAYLASIALPDIGLIVNVGPAHLERLGSEEGVARTKGGVYSALPKDGWAVMNAGQQWLELWREMNTAEHCLTFGYSPDCDVFTPESGDEPTVHTPQGSFRLRLALPGQHNRENALAATAVAIAAGIGVDEIQQGLASVRPVPGRLRLQQAPGGWSVIDDTYNANPASLYAALQVLAIQGGEPWLVLGDMAELGGYSRKMHAEMGEAACSLGVTRLYTVGEYSQFATDAFGAGACHFPDIESLLDHLLAEIDGHVTCLVKGSRSAGMERVVEAINRSSTARETG
jgi:UDP-N-acetylmuramoyl-tripeptide--D-alanyl-D-alanine ligase